MPSGISATQFTRWHLDHHAALGSDQDDPKRHHLSPKRNARWFKLLYCTPVLIPLYFRAAASEARSYPRELKLSHSVRVHSRRPRFVFVKALLRLFGIAAVVVTLAVVLILVARQWKAASAALNAVAPPPAAAGAPAGASSAGGVGSSSSVRQMKDKTDAHVEDLQKALDATE